MGKRDDGGQAFPRPVSVGPSDDMYPAIPGMTMRDYFAGQVIGGLSTAPFPDEDFDQLAKMAYRLADAMLAERSK